MLNNHPKVAPKDHVDDVISYLRYAAKFSPPPEEIPVQSTPGWYWGIVILLCINATVTSLALAAWVALRIALRMLGW